MPAAALRLVESVAAPRPQPRSLAPAAARGARLFDPSGRSLVDFHNAGGAVLLGHAHPVVEAAAAEPLDPRFLRATLAEQLCALHARADAIRLERDPAVALTYALDCAARATGGRGSIPALAVAADASLAQGVAAVVLDPFVQGVDPSTARAARGAADRADVLLILDERRSAFRCGHHGAEALLGVTADITVYGRSLANGRPLAAVCGPRALLDPTQAMPEACADAALAAAVATFKVIRAEPVTTALRVRGAEVEAELEMQIEARGLTAAVAVGGDPAWSRMAFAEDADGALQRLWRRTLYAHDIYTQGEQVMSYAHGDAEITALLTASAAALDEIARLRAV